VQSPRNAIINRPIQPVQEAGNQEGALVSSNSRTNVERVLGPEILSLFSHLDSGASLFGNLIDHPVMIKASVSSDIGRGFGEKLDSNLDTRNDGFKVKADLRFQCHTIKSTTRMKDHRRIDERSVAFHRLIAAKVRTTPSSLQLARDNIGRWLRDCSPGVRPALLEWAGLLDGALEDVLAVMESGDERAVRLRQSSPFAGFLTAEERNAILREFQRNVAIEMGDR
jgi:hypothetical protein